MVNYPTLTNVYCLLSTRNKIHRIRWYVANLFVVVIFYENLHVLGICVENAAPIAGMPSNGGHGTDNTVLATC